ncbi:FxSxx-COOH system tetratricopeptide repeat protein [Herbidospora galbida]|uniref:FxSxx-COOH system tetratricopeptide repeat protein n=1 Tax=Herbidospora galbida TaxID=2575442 RepID=UPI001484EC2C|nr:FxSxx-COOH system tetratricopeptide repeat protein [Herbidospora galbida]
MPDPEYTRDFFIHHADDDVAWAEWIACELEQAGYGVILTAWDIRPGHNRLEEIDKALATSRHTLHLLSSEQDAEAVVRTAAQHQGLAGKERALIPIRLRDGDVAGSVAALQPIDLCDVDEDEARRRLLSGVGNSTERVARGGFPNKSAKPVRFPGAEQEVWELRGHRSDPRFTGRDELLADLHRDLRASAIQAITGLGGLGKTQVAIEYAFRHGGSYDLIWWIRAEDPATLRGDYVELAKELGLPFDTDDQAIAALRQSLRRRRNWLLLFDNAEDPKELLPLLPEKLTGHVLITSRKPEWPHVQVRHLDMLTVPAAVEYLRQWGRMSDADTARELAEALGCLPLALAQAASVIADGMSAAEYLEHLRKESPALFAAGSHQETIASTWRVSFDRLADRSPAAVALFRLAAFLGAEAIPLDQLVPVTGMPAELAEVLKDPFKRVAATKALGEYSLAKTGDGLMSIHRIVQAVTRAELGADQTRWAEIALNATSNTFPSEVETPGSWPACETMLAHALSSAEHAQRIEADVTKTSDLLDRIARYLLARGRLERAASVVETALKSAGFSADALDYLRCRNTQGLILLSRGDFPGARQAQEEVYRARIQKLGAHDVDTLRAGRDFVEALFRQGHWAQATEVQNELVDAFTAILGAEDLESVTAVAYQATLIGAAGLYREARTLEERVVEMRFRLLGEEHTDTLKANANLAATLRALGEFRQARTIQEHVLAARKRILGDEHPHTLDANANLASTLRELGEFRQARTLEEHVLTARKRILGDEHPHTLTANAHLAITLNMLGESHEARTIQEHVFTASQRILGDEHPHTLTANANLADTLRRLGEYRQARTMQEHVLTARKRILGDEHPDTLTANANLAATLRELGEYRQARTLEEHVLTARKRILGDEHPDTLTANAHLAATLHALGEYRQARTMQEHVLTARKRILGDEHPDTLTVIAHLAITLNALEETADARLLLREALDISVRAHGKKNPLTSRMAMELASVFSSPHEANAKKAIIVQHLSWLSKEPPGNLSGEQKTIKERIKGLLFGGGKAGKRRQPKGRK